MAKIIVDRSEFKTAASKIEDHIKMMKNSMILAKSFNQDLNGIYDGKDKIDFQNKFESLFNKDSTFEAYIKTLEGYAAFIKNADELYRKAQEDAYNKASKILQSSLL